MWVKGKIYTVFLKPTLSAFTGDDVLFEGYEKKGAVESSQDVFWLPKSTISRSLSPLLLEISILMASFCHWELWQKNHLDTIVFLSNGIWEFAG